MTEQPFNLKQARMVGEHYLRRAIFEGESVLLAPAKMLMTACEEIERLESELKQRDLDD